MPFLYRYLIQKQPLTESKDCISIPILIRSYSYTFNMIICLTSNSIRRIYYEYPFSVIRYKRNLFEYHEICLEGMWTDNKTMHRIIRMSWSWRPLRRSKWSLVSFNLFLYPLITVKNTWIKLQASTYVDGIILCYKHLLLISTMIRMMNNWKINRDAYQT